MKKFLFALPLLALSLWSCSNDEPGPVTPDENGYGDSYLSISISVPTGAGSRASTADGQYNKDPMDNFDDGTANESKVNNIVFFFFDENNNIVDIQKLDPDNFKPETDNKNPYVTSIGIKEVRLKSGLHYDQVAIALNSSETVSSLRTSVKNLANLQDRSSNYVDKIASDGSNQLMSNSVYFEEADGTVDPTEDNRVVLVKITEENIYTSAEKNKLGTEKKYVDIYVERVAARVDVTLSENITDDFYAIEENGVKTDVLKLFNNVTYTEEEIVVFPEINGMMLDVLTPTAKLIKPLNLDEFTGYKKGVTDYTAFQWNDPRNKRSYWATTADVPKDDATLPSMKYFSWDAMAANGTDKFSQYIHPNTQDYIPEANNEELSKNTKVVVAATLMYYKKNGETVDDAKPLDMVRYGSEHMLAPNLLAQTANLTNIAVRSISWETVQDDNEDASKRVTFTNEERLILGVAVNNSFIGIRDNEEGLKANQFDIVMNDAIDDENRDEVVPYEAKVVTANNFKYDVKFEASLYDDYNDEAVQALVAAYSVEGSTAWKELVERASVFIDKTIENTLVDINNQRILYWKGGKTYYYYVIRHQGFYGLTGTGSNNYLFGVVRNHIYNVKLNGLFGLGTPVIDSGEPIDPERPKDERPSFISARINILPWRVVPNDAVVH